MNSKRRILPIIVIAQFCCTSLWFASNAVMGNLAVAFNLHENVLVHLTSAVQLGFILGTLVFAVLTIADRYSPSMVFFFSAILGALFNLGTILTANTFISLLILRMLTGFFLAGIYPVGMKIAADYYQKGLGKSLGFLVGALVVGTALPHLLKGLTANLPWRLVLILTSAIAIIGGLLLLLFVADGPFRKRSQKPDFSAPFLVFKNKMFRSAAFGYFGHMWELYAFWAYVPKIMATYLRLHPTSQINIPLWSFLIIGIGGLACIIGGYISLSFGTKRTAALALLLSGSCCLFSPFIFSLNSPEILLSFLIFWGSVVVADSPLFSTLLAKNTRAETKGTALTIANSIGFTITIVSIQLLSFLQNIVNPSYIYSFLAIGPVLGLWALYKQKPIPVSGYN